MVQRLEHALERWAVLAKEKGYANQEVPAGTAVAPPEIESAPLALRVSLRDLPGATHYDTGRRFTDEDRRARRWSSFTDWAWNQNWVTLKDPTELVPRGATASARQAPQPVAAEVVDPIYRNVLIDNVRGQNPPWPKEAVEEASLTMGVLAEEGDCLTIEYRGQALLKTATQRYEPGLYGRAVWNRKESRFESFQLVAVGEREGTAQFNQRKHDKGPAPLGIVLDLF